MYNIYLVQLSKARNLFGQHICELDWQHSYYFFLGSLTDVLNIAREYIKYTFQINENI